VGDFYVSLVMAFSVSGRKGIADWHVLFVVWRVALLYFSMNWLVCFQFAKGRFG
jgi:hypothetical protein